MSDEIKWLIGLGATIGLGIAGYVIAALRALSNQIKTGDDALHARINRVRDDYVKKEDFNAQIARVDSNIRDFREENREFHKETNQRLDMLLKK